MIQIDIWNIILLFYLSRLHQPGGVLQIQNVDDTFAFVKFILHKNSIIAFVIPLVIIGAINIFIHREVWKSAVISLITMTVLTIIMFQLLLIMNPDLFKQYWHLANLSGIFIFNIPVEELVFAASIGFGSANAFEVIWGYKMINNTFRKMRGK